GADPAWITAAGELRTLPCHLPDADPRLAGLDGFFAARLAVGGSILVGSGQTRAGPAAVCTAFVVNST
ncbi:hypothetical protein HC891_18850, partial [Candidatus Gracilibacteria bacterium]|nr:hypothetical protein [Candidatus Gracilibacteria bacterium]